MIEKIHKVITQSGITSGIYNLVYTFVKTQFDGLKATLSEQSYSNIAGIVDKIATVSVILITIYIIYSIIHFIISLIKGKFRLKVLISILFALPFLILSYVLFAYFNIT